MQKQWKQFDLLQDKFHKRFGSRIIKKKHKGKRIDKAINTSNFLYRNWLYVGEFCVALVLSFSTLIFGNGNQTPNNLELVYPLQEVSTLDCRTQERNSLTDSCKKTLPIIEGANYNNYANNTEYNEIYTVLYGGNYNSGWRTDLGSHYGVDIATAKGTPLYAIADGKVYFAGQQAGYGNVVKIEFVYQGIKYFAIYAHMGSLSVKTGESVSKGQKVWTVGNSGTTMGGLWGYHVHFEIAKGEKGRPIYAFFGCTDLKNWSIQVINQGLCRTEMFNYTLDPIALLESANAKLPHPTKTSTNTEIEHWTAIEIRQDTAEREQILKLAKLYLDSPYQLGATGTLPWNPTDCSKFTQNVFANVGIELERSSADQAYQFSLGGYRYDSLERAESGDLIFFKNTYNSDREITHVGIYAGNGTMIHAGSKKVEIVPLDSYWKEHFKGIWSFKLLSKNYNPEKANKNYLALSSVPNSHSAAPWIPQPPIKTLNSDPLISQQTEPPIAQSLISLDSSRLDAIGKAFFDERKIHLTWDSTRELKKWETRIFKLQISKDNGDTFNGILKQPIILVANSTNISIEPVAISLVKDGVVEIKVTANQSGPVYTAINMGTNKMGGMTMQVM